jgi:hypothetical protein
MMGGIGGYPVSLLLFRQGPFPDGSRLEPFGVTIERSDDLDNVGGAITEPIVGSVKTDHQLTRHGAPRQELSKRFGLHATSSSAATAQVPLGLS